ncbi:MAG: ACP S-malonyltransferase [Clostridiaceae bacterium]|nr:ACP S-malonyltransferase [Clostridiaceae bacterium]
MLACVFSGQGSQYPGMGRQICAGHENARLVYEEAADILGCDLLSLSGDQLTLTRYIQPSVVTLSLAVWRAFVSAVNDQGGPGLPVSSCRFAGFSLGEYSALGAAGILDFASLLGLVRERARLMQEAAEQKPGAMYAILGLTDDQIMAVLEQPAYQSRIFAANFNAPGQLVISGEEAAAADCARVLQLAGARRTIRLNVNGAFHTPLMADAARALSHYASGLTFHATEGRIYGNPDGRCLTGPTNWPEHLAVQMASPVRWVDEVLCLSHDGASRFVEFGPGKVLCGLIRKIIPAAAVWPVEDNDSLAAVLAALKPS